ncbi:MAG: fibronectin type III domain-containing protein [Candidatus Latescibacterota bacterium]
MAATAGLQCLPSGGSRAAWLAALVLAVLALAGSSGAVYLGLPEVTAAPGETVLVPLRIESLGGDTVLSANLDIRFDATLVDLASLAVERSGTLTSEWIVAHNARQVPGGSAATGQVLVGAATASARVPGPGVFLYLQLTVPADAPVGASSPLRVERVLLNSGRPTATTGDGLLTVALPEMRVDFIAAPTAGPAPLDVQFYQRAFGEGVESYEWAFGDGGTSGEPDPRHVYEEAGSYTVSLTVTGTAGSATAYKEDYIRVTPDLTPPDIIEGPVALGVTHNAATIFWRLNEAGDALVQYCGLRLRPRWGSLDELIAALVEELAEHGYLDCEGDDQGDEGDSRGPRRAVALEGVDATAALQAEVWLGSFAGGPGPEGRLLRADATGVELDLAAAPQCGSGVAGQGAWQSSTPVRVEYEAQSGRLHLQLDAGQSFCQTLELGAPAALDYLQIDLHDESRGAGLRLQNVRLDGQQLGTFTATGQESWQVRGFDPAQGFVLEGEVILSPSPAGGDASSVRIRAGHLPPGGMDECGELASRWLLRGELPHFQENAAALLPLIARCGEVHEEELALSHEVRLEGLSPFTFYLYRVRSTDGDGNPSAWKGGFFITRSRPDDDPPRIVQGPQATAGSERALIWWVTDEPSNSFVQYSRDPDFEGDQRVLLPELVHRHEVWIEGLTPGATYYYRVRSTDASGNASPLKRGELRTVAVDRTPPVIWGQPQVTARTPTTALIEWETDEAATSRVDYGTGEAYGSFVESARLVQRHQVLLTHLQPRTLYHFRVVSTDLSGNRAASGDETFVTRQEPDTRPCGMVREPYLVSRFHDRVIVGWSLDEPGRGHVEYGSGEDYEQRVEVPEFGREHTATLTGLAPGAQYRCRVQMVDLEGNGPTRSRSLTFRTSPQRDTQPPVFAGWPVVRDRTDTEATIAWDTDEASDTHVEYGPTAAYGRAVQSGELVRRHEVRLTGLEPATTYHFRAHATDADGNGPASSADVTFATRPAPDREPPILVAGPAVVARTTTSAVIEWRTDELSRGMVEFGPEPVYGHEAFSEAFDVTHRVRLNHLLPGRTYYYRVWATDGSGNGPTGSRDLFLTTPEETDGVVPRIWGVSVRKVTGSSALVEWWTGKPADSAVDLAVGSQPPLRTESPELVRHHQQRLSGLLADTEYTFRVASVDIDGNGALSEPQGFRTARLADRTPPVVIHGPEIVTSHAAATFVWRTDEPCFAAVVVGTEETFGTPAERVVQSMEAAEEHALTVTGLERGTRYLFSLLSRDLEDNETVLGQPRRAGKVVRPLAGVGGLSFTTAAEPDFQAPGIVDGPRVLWLTDTETLVGWTTDEVADTRLLLEEDGRQVSAEVIPEHTFEHQVLLTGLRPGRTYRVRAAAADPAGNGPVPSALLAFTTSAEADAAAPQLLGAPRVEAARQEMATIAWETDEASSSQVLFGQEGLDRSVSDPALVTAHRVELTGLEPGVTYRYQVRSLDARGNGPVASDILALTTAAAPDVQAPHIVSGPALEQVTERTAAVAWQTDEPADGFVRFGLGEALDQTSGRAELVTRHRVLLSPLVAGRTYRLAVSSADRDGNGPTESAVIMLTTLAQPDRVGPGAPGGLTAERVGSGQVQLAWTPVEAADLAGYHVYRAPAGGSFARIAGPLSSPAYCDRGLTLGGEYAYRVSAVDASGNEGAPGPAVRIAAAQPGDFQGDGVVGFDDFFLLAERFGAQRGEAFYGAAFDLDADGRIGFGDFFAFVDLFGTSYGAARLVAAPLEPGPLPRVEVEEAGAGQFEVRVSAEPQGVRGFGLRLEYDAASLHLLQARAAGPGFLAPEEALAGVLQQESGRVSLGAHLLPGQQAGGTGLLAVVRLAAEPGAAPGAVRLAEVELVEQGGRRLAGSLPAGGLVVRPLPARFALAPNVPNPFNPRTRIRFALPVEAPVRLRVHDVLGQVVAVLLDGDLPPGYHEVTWDGTATGGVPAATGVYLCTLEAGAFRQVRKMLLVR